MWLFIRLNNAGKWMCDRLTEDADFGKIFSDEAHFDLGGSKIVPLGAQNLTADLTAN